MKMVQVRLQVSMNMQPAVSIPLCMNNQLLISYSQVKLKLFVVDSRVLNHIVNNMASC